MTGKQPGVRSVLSRLKNRLVSRDLQDIYQYGEALSDVVSAGQGRSGCRDISYQIYHTTKALALMERVHPQDEQARHFVIERLLAGDKVVIGLDQDQPVFYGWLMFDEIEITYGVFRSIPQGMAFGYNLYTKSSHRRLGVMTGFYAFVRSYLKQNKIQRFYVGIATDNKVSIKAHQNNGFRKSGYFYTLKLLGTCFTLARFKYAKRFYVTHEQ